MNRTLSIVVACFSAGVLLACSKGDKSSGSSQSDVGTDAAVDINRTTYPACFNQADTLAEYLANHRSCSADADCQFAIPTLLVCMLPELESGFGCTGYVAVNSTADPITIRNSLIAIDQCLMPPNGGTLGTTRTVNGKPCQQGCGAVPPVICTAGQCVIVTEQTEPDGSTP